MKTIITNNKQVVNLNTPLGVIRMFGINPDELSKLKISKLSVDAEWYTSGQNTIDNKTYEEITFLTKQCTVLTDSDELINFVLWNQNYQIPSDAFLASKVVPTVLVISDIQDMTVIEVFNYLNFKFTGKRTDMYMFFSPVDLLVVTEGIYLKHFYANEIITKTRNVNGCFTIEKFDGVDDDDMEFLENRLDNEDDKNKKENENFRIRIKDLFGAANSSLAKLYNLVGIEDTAKNLVAGEMKSRMNEVITQSPKKFFDYAISDSYMLYILWDKRVEQINNIIKKALGFSPDFTTDDCPRSSGQLVSEVFMKWLTFKYPLLVAGVETLAVPLSNKRDLFKFFCSKLSEQKENIESGFINLGNKDIPLDKIHNKWSEYQGGSGISGMARASIGSFGGLGNNDSVYNSIVNGGRCNNEKPYDWRINDVLDIDLSSCYGTALRDLIFPIGRPKIVAFNEDEEITLGEFRKKHVNKLEDGLWQAVIEGELDFEQDLIYSKLGLTRENIKQSLRDEEHSTDEEHIVDKTHIDGKFRLLRKQIVKGIITTHSLNILYKVASNAEKKSLDGLKVLTYTGYFKKDRRSHDEFFDIVSNPKTLGKPGVVNPRDNAISGDERTHSWTAIKLEEFIGDFISYRKILKTQKITKGDKYDIQQNAVKLFINTFYGCLASPYFPCSNAILANNITDKARTGVWMLSKALGTVQSITDGGAYSNGSVRYLKPELWQGRLPRLKELDDYNSLNKHRSIVVDKLFPDFKNIYQGTKTNGGKYQDLLDSTATNHINDFWSHYGLELPFKIEHKIENTSESLVYFNASDYLLVNPVKPSKYGFIEDLKLIRVENEEFDGCNFKYSIKVRGAKDDFHIKKQWLMYLGGFVKKPNYCFEEKNLVGIKEFIQGCKSSEKWTEHTLPGYSVIGTTFLKPELRHLPKIDVQSVHMMDLTIYKRTSKHNKIKHDNGYTAYFTYDMFDNVFNPEQMRKFLSDRELFESELKSGKGKSRKGRGGNYN